MAACNLLHKDDKALVVNTGYFGDRFGEWYVFFASLAHAVSGKKIDKHSSLAAYGADVTHARAPIGDCPSVEEVVKLLGPRFV